MLWSSSFFTAELRSSKNAARAPSGSQCDRTRYFFPPLSSAAKKQQHLWIRPLDAVKSSYALRQNMKPKLHISSQFKSGFRQPGTMQWVSESTVVYEPLWKIAYACWMVFYVLYIYDVSTLYELNPTSFITQCHSILLLTKAHIPHGFCPCRLHDPQHSLLVIKADAHLPFFFFSSVKPGWIQPYGLHPSTLFS